LDNEIYQVEDVLEDLNRGKLTVLIGNYKNYNIGMLVGLGENVTPQSINFMSIYGKGIICSPIALSVARRLELRPMVFNNMDFGSPIFTISVDHTQTSTGISASDRALTVKSLASNSVGAGDFKRPGHIFPIIASEEGVLERKLLPEGAVDLARLCKSTPVTTSCVVLNSSGHLADVQELFRLAKKHDMTVISVDQIVGYRKSTEKIKKRVQTNGPNQSEIAVYAY